MSITTLDALNAYGRVVNGPSSAPLPSPADAAPAADAPDFGGMVQSLVQDTAGALRTAEAASAQQVAGKGDLIDVVTAIGSAEMALNTVVAVRDRMVGAYNEIMRMQV